jgi:hypothetical protein
MVRSSRRGRGPDGGAGRRGRAQEAPGHVRGFQERAPRAERHRGVGVRIYTYPKIIFIWPTLVFALICGIGMWVLNDDVRDPRTIASTTAADTAVEAPAEGQTATSAATSPKIRRFSSWPNILGMLFLFVFAINVMIMAIDFPRFTIIAALLLILALTFFLLWLGVFFDLLTPLRDFAEGVYAVANSGFYLMVALILGVMFLIIIATRGSTTGRSCPTRSSTTTGR